MGKTVGLLSPGLRLAPRITSEFVAHLGPDVDVIDAAALDGVGPAEIEQWLTPLPQAAVPTALADGSVVPVDADRLTGRLQDQLRRLEAMGADAVVLWSTFPLPVRSERCLLVDPARLVLHVALALAGGGALGVVTPVSRALSPVRHRWEAYPGEVVFAVATPFGPDGEWSAVARALREAGAGMVVLDSMDYGEEARSELHRVLRVPVLRAASLVARLVADALGS